MSFRLKEAVFKIRCREPGCPFYSEFVVKENIMGLTEAEVDSEALKIAKNMGFIKHDAIYGRKHQLVNPEIFKVGSSYERVGGLTAASTFSPNREADGAPRAFRRGEVIVKKREAAAFACEVVSGSAFNLGHPGLRYKTGAVFGTAALFNQRNRPVDIVAAEDGTRVAFHNVKELTRSNPSKARDLYDKAMEDVFRVLVHLEDYSSSLAKKVGKLGGQKSAKKPARSKPAARPKAAARKTVRKAAKKPTAKKPAPKRKAARGKKR